MTRQNPFTVLNSRFLLMTLVGLFVFLHAEGAAAQRSGASRTWGSVPRYNPATPTTSPYLGLLVNNAGINGYYSLVRPRQNQTLLNRQQKDSIQTQSLRIDAVQSRLAAPTERPLVNGVGESGRDRPSAWFGVPSETSGFRNRSSFYQRWDDRRLNLRR